MAAFAWSPRFETGLPKVDAQHRRLVELVGQLEEARLAGATADAERLIADTRDYARFHFAAEEAIWSNAGLPAAAQSAHARAHQEFVEHLEHLWSSAAPLAHRLAVVHDFLMAWLVVHIIGEDKRMAARATQPTEASSPEAARPASEAVLLDAVHDLYTRLSAMNAGLLAANARLEAEVAAAWRATAGAASAVQAPLGLLTGTLAALEAEAAAPRAAHLRELVERAKAEVTLVEHAVSALGAAARDPRTRE